ncbi:MAG TPA: hypothetical protein VKF42_03125, partial [Chitinivibrionales bacterium]|nr:hypothetical protein [Chitinivibrionales bacterium]
MRPIRLAIDVMSGDNGSRVILNGILEAQRLSRDPFIAYLCGDEKVIRSLMAETGMAENSGSGRLIVEPCGDSVGPNDVPTRVWKTRADAP